MRRHTRPPTPQRTRSETKCGIVCSSFQNNFSTPKDFICWLVVLVCTVFVCFVLHTKQGCMEVSVRCSLAEDRVGGC